MLFIQCIFNLITDDDYTGFGDTGIDVNPFFGHFVCYDCRMWRKRMIAKENDIDNFLYIIRSGKFRIEFCGDEKSPLLGLDFFDM